MRPVKQMLPRPSCSLWTVTKRELLSIFCIACMPGCRWNLRWEWQPQEGLKARDERGLVLLAGSPTSKRCFISEMMQERVWLAVVCNAAPASTVSVFLSLLPRSLSSKCADGIMHGTPSLPIYCSFAKMIVKKNSPTSPLWGVISFEWVSPPVCVAFLSTQAIILRYSSYPANSWLMMRVFYNSKLYYNLVVFDKVRM